MTSPQDPSSVATAIRTLATLERLDLNPRLPKSEAVEWSASAILAAAGPAALDEIEAAIPTATGTGRVALALAVRSIDPERGAQLAARLADDPTAAWVDTCLVGFRSVAQWARTQGPLPRISGVAADPAPATTGSPATLLLVVAGALVLLAVYLAR